MSHSQTQLDNTSTRRNSHNKDSTQSKRKSNAYMAAEAVQHERDAVRTLKRLSIGGSLTIDPDLPFGVDIELENFQQKQQNKHRSSSGSSISSHSDSIDMSLNDSTLVNDHNEDQTNENDKEDNGDGDGDGDGDDNDDAKLNAEKLLWVPAKSHPSIAPDKFRRYIESTLGDMHKRIHSKDKSTYSVPSLKELANELDRLSEMAGLAATDAITLARSLSSVSSTSSSSLLLQQNPNLRRANSAGAVETLQSTRDMFSKESLFSSSKKDLEDLMKEYQDNDAGSTGEDQDVSLFMESSNSLKRNKWITYSKSGRTNNAKPIKAHSPLIDEKKFTLDDSLKGNGPPDVPLKSYSQQRNRHHPTREKENDTQRKQSSQPQNIQQRRPSLAHNQHPLPPQQYSQSKNHQKPLPVPLVHSRPHPEQHHSQYQKQQQLHPQQNSCPQQRSHQRQQHQSYRQDKPLPNHYSNHGHSPSSQHPQQKQEIHHRQVSTPQSQYRNTSISKKSYGPLHTQSQNQSLHPIPRSSSESHERPNNKQSMSRSHSDVHKQQLPNTVQKRTNHSRNRHADSLISLDSEKSSSSGSSSTVASGLIVSPSQQKPILSIAPLEQSRARVQSQQQSQPSKQLSSPFEPSKIPTKEQKKVSSAPSCQLDKNQLPTPPTTTSSSSSSSSPSSSSSSPISSSSPALNQITNLGDSFIEPSPDVSSKKESKSKEFLSLFKMKRSTSPKAIKEQTKKKEEPLNDQETQIISGQPQKSPQRPGLKTSTFKLGEKEDKKTSPIKSAFNYKTGGSKAQDVSDKKTSSPENNSQISPTEQMQIPTNQSSQQSSSPTWDPSDDHHRLHKESLSKTLSLENMKKSSKPNAPVQFTDSAFGFPLPPLSNSTIVMLDYRFPIHVERALYRLSHLKLANPKRPLREQVLLSNFMYAYLNLVNHTLYLQQLNEEVVGSEEVQLEDL